MAPRYVPILELGRRPLGTTFVGACHRSAGYFHLVTYTRLCDELADDDALLAAACAELRHVGRLYHRNVALFFELDGDERIFVTEYLDGPSLEAVFERRGSAVATEIYLRLLCDVLAGLDYAHEFRDDGGAPLAIVHGDLSARRVVVTCEGEGKLLDFGSAKLAATLRRQDPAELEAALAHLAPEQARRPQEAHGRLVDIFAVGGLLWRVLTGHRPWRGLAPPEITRLLADGHVPSVRTVAPHAPPDLIAACDRARAPDPADRFPTALAFREALEGHLMRCSGPRPTRKRIGRAVAELVAADRAKVRTAVEAHLRARTAATTPRPRPPEGTVYES
jgi:serine/threonine-protein kinase